MSCRTGRTTKQLREAPHGAIFIWQTADTAYPKKLAKDLGREDIRVVSPDWLRHGWQGMDLCAVILDHDTRLEGGQWDGLEAARARIGRAA